mmetsp:Transcript_12284/g.30028  ORF Transcript_12284/g.30028 Transcript_12284/m.30028 type:complete len:267 (-) Transcript_12284:746-1546(-)
MLPTTVVRMASARFGPRISTMDWMKSSSKRRISVFRASTSFTARMMSDCFSIFIFGLSVFLSPFSALSSFASSLSPMPKNSFCASLTEAAASSSTSSASITASNTPASTPISSISSKTAALVISLDNSATSLIKSAPTDKKSRSSLSNAVPSPEVSPCSRLLPSPSPLVMPIALHSASSKPLARSSLAAAALPFVALIMLYLYESYLAFIFVTLRNCCFGMPMFNLAVGPSMLRLFPGPPLLGPPKNLRNGDAFSAGPERSSYMSS